MSQENVEIVRQVFELFHPDFELDATQLPMADLRGRYRGLTEVAEFWRRWLEPWESHVFEVELTDVGDRVLAELSQRMRGKGSGIEVPFPPAWQVFALREGKVISQALYLDESEARDAAGLTA
jgi:hypothetical protein